MQTVAEKNHRQRLAELSSQCVKCGLCLPACPTFGLTGNEAASPRGRITLSEHIIGAESADASKNHSIYVRIDDCLQCQACESACPSGVQVSEIISLTRALMPDTAPRRLSRRLSAVLQHRQQRQWLARTLRLIQKLRLDRPVARVLPEPLARGLRHALPVPAHAQLPEWFAAAGTSGSSRKDPENHRAETVALLTGCTAELHDAPVLQTLAQLVSACGFNVWIPPQQKCCGALAYHNGDAISHLLTANEAAFKAGTEDTPLRAVLVLNTGCAAHLLSQSRQRPNSPLYCDALAFLHQHRKNLRFRACAETVFVHQPCSQQHGVKSADAMLELLRGVPGLEIHSKATDCCGAAGSYFLTQPELSGQLAQQWRKAVLPTRPDRLLSANIGCAMQWHGLDTGIPVEHPVAFLARHLIP